MKKKLLSIMVAVFVILSVMCVNVFAAEGDVAAIGETEYATLAAAIANVKNGDTIKLLADCGENVTITQAKNVSFTIDGDGKTYTGTITVQSKSALMNSSETLTIQNVNFVAKTYGQSCINTPKNSYAHNLTIDNCTFKGEDAGYQAAYAIYLRVAYDVTVTNVEAEGVYDLVYGNRAVTGLTVENVTVKDSAQGFMLPYATGDILFKNVTIEGGKSAGVILYNNAPFDAVFENCSIEAVPAVVYEATTNKPATITINDTNDLVPTEDGLLVQVIGDDAKLTNTTVVCDLSRDTVEVDGSVYTVVDELHITNAEELRAFAELVDMGRIAAGANVYLDADIDLENELFDPIGSYRFDKSFKGTFHGQGHTISNLSMNTWELDNGYYYNDCGLGLFGAVEDAVIKDLTIDGAEISGESAICGTVAAVAADTVFENITVKNANVADYQYYAGGIVGWASGEITVDGCLIDETTTVATQWGDFDNSTGGVMGGASTSAEVLIKDTTVACRIDTHNDVVSAYQWYAYRRAGMLIGNSGDSTGSGGVALAPQLTCENVTVIYGDWAHYHYCEFAGTGYPFVRVEAGVSVDAYSNVRYGHPTDANGNEVVDHNHVHNDGEQHFLILNFDQLYGGGQGVYGQATHDGVTIIEPVVAKVGNNEFRSLREAVAYAEENGGDVVVVGELCDTCEPIEPSEDVNVLVSVSFDANGGEAVADQTVIFGSAYGELPIPARTGYTFNGWFDAEGNKVTDETIVETVISHTLTAEWTVNVYNITYVLDWGAIYDGSVDTYTYGVGAKLPTNVGKVDYAFEGWYTNANFTGEKVTAISATELGDKTFYAKWRYNRGAASAEPAAPKAECPRDTTCPMYSFADLNMALWYHDGIHFALETGLMNGTGANTFEPNKATTRAMIVTMLWRLEGEPAVSYNMTFEDVAAGQWYTEAIRWAASKGIVEGYSEAKFGPNDVITREQLATIMWRYAKAKGYDVSIGENTNILSYDDAFTISSWAIPAMQWACGEGLIQGISNGTTMILAHGDSATRAQAAAILQRFCENVVNN